MATFTDNFVDGDANPLDPTKYDAGYTSYDNLTVSSGHVTGNSNASGVVNLESYKGASFNADQFAEVKLLAITGTSLLRGGVVLRTAAPATRTFYRCFAARNDTGLALTTGLSSLVGEPPTRTEIASENATTWVANDVIRATVSGTAPGAFVIYRNGSSLVTGNDASIASGRIGMYLYCEGTLATDLLFDNFYGGDLADLSPAVLVQAHYRWRNDDGGLQAP